MCGIAGFFHPEGRLPADCRELLKRMGESIRHRGPDDHGDFCDAGCGFAFRRLAVIDLHGGHQPMVSASGRYVIMMNGELYNYRSLRMELAGLGSVFQTQSDVEVVIAGYEAWGAAILERLRGMFALAIFDRQERRLFLARDHTGIKPLYYCQHEGFLLFASEVKALLQFPGMRAQVNVERLPQYLSFLWVPAPETMFAGINMLEPAHTILLDRSGMKTECYWSPDLLSRDVFSKEEEWRERLRAELTAVVAEQLVSDVPLGALLSGGIDSSLIIALMNRLRPDPVTTFTTGFDRTDLAQDVIVSDIEHARIAAQSLNVRYNELILRPDVVGLLPKLIWHMDEPVADPAAVTTYLICQAVKPHCTVMLSGAGGDEIFGGYPRYRAELLAERYRRLPSLIRHALIEKILGLFSSGNRRFIRNAKKFVKSASLPLKESYFGYLTYYAHEELLALMKPDFDWPGIFGRHDGYWQDYRETDLLQQMMNVDLKTFLPNLNLMYTDKMSAAAAVEVRVPYLDHLLIEQVSRIPATLKIRGTVQKYILKKVADEYLPSSITWRKKAGFGAPVGAWLKGEVREMMLDLLSEGTVSRRGYFQYPAVTKIIDDHLSGKEYNANQLWQLMTLELWHQEFIDKK